MYASLDCLEEVSCLIPRRMKESIAEAAADWITCCVDIQNKTAQFACLYNDKCIDGSRIVRPLMISSLRAGFWI